MMQVKKPRNRRENVFGEARFTLPPVVGALMLRMLDSVRKYGGPDDGKTIRRFIQEATRRHVDRANMRYEAVEIGLRLGEDAAYAHICHGLVAEAKADMEAVKQIIAEHVADQAKQGETKAAA